MEKNKRLQRRFESKLLVLDRAIFMKPLEQRPQYVNYMTGVQMPAREFTHGGLDIFYDYVWNDVKKDHVGRQPGFPNFLDFDDVWYTKSRPIEIKSGEQVHLSEVRPLKNGTTISSTDKFDQAFEGMRIDTIREELSQINSI